MHQGIFVLHWCFHCNATCEHNGMDYQSHGERKKGSVVSVGAGEWE